MCLDVYHKAVSRGSLYLTFRVDIFTYPLFTYHAYIYT